MIGNVWEWTSTRSRQNDGATCFGDPYRPDDGREDPTTRDARWLCGGSFQMDCEAVSCLSRREQEPLRAQDTGFRVCVSAAA
jgi:formylglycine-generating enzyme required for sulfatase activity